MRFPLRSIVLFPLIFLALAGMLVNAGASQSRVPEWAKDAIWYQIFPERFRNGDSANDPGRSSLEWPYRPGPKWRLSPWTGDWYARDAWETEQDRRQSADSAPAFYRNGVLDRRYGGDLQGVLDKLGYLAELGITAIYFNPVFYARSLHKYDGNSFHHVDPYFGPDPKGDFALMDTETADPATWKWTEADKLFLKLIREAHARGIRVIIDGVFNHSGRDFFAFVDLRKNGPASPYASWYQVLSFDDPETSRNEFTYRGWWGHKTLPIFSATEDGKDMAMGPKNYIFSATRRWMDPNGDGDPSDGIDGWRLDVADERPAKFWADWNAFVRVLNPQAYTTAEVWSNPLELIEHGDFSASMNYYGFALPVTGFFIDENLTASRFVDMLEQRRKALPETIAVAMQNLMDSHDTDRVASMVVNGHNHGNPDHIDYNNANNAWGSADYKLRKPNARERDIQRLIALFQMTYVGAPMIYYGTEAGMWGGGDPDCRMPMVWEDLNFAPQATDPRGRRRDADDVNFDRELFQFYAAAIALRKKFPALRGSAFRPLGAFDARKTFVFLRGEGEESLVVAFNRSDTSQSVEVDFPDNMGAGLASLGVIFASRAGQSGIQANAMGRRLRITLPALTGVVLAKKQESNQAPSGVSGNKTPPGNQIAFSLE